MQTERGGRKWYNYEADVLTIYATTPGKFILDGNPLKQKGSYFTETFCKVMQKSMDQSLDRVVKLVRKEIIEKALGREIVETVSTMNGEIFLTQPTATTNLITEEQQKESEEEKKRNGFDGLVWVIE